MALVVTAALVVAAVVVGVSAAGDDEVAVREEESSVPVGPEPDGDEVTLDVSVFSPPAATPGADDDGRRAAVVLAHGFGGNKDQQSGQARELAAEGYVVLTYTARGFGRSGGRIHLDSPDYEVADVSVLLDLLAERDDVLLDDGGDPRVGIAGGSYGGAVALMAAGYDDRVDAIVPAITWNDLGESLFPGGVFKRRWSSIFFATGAFGGRDGGSSEGAGPCGRFDPEVCALYSDAATTGRATPAILRLLRRSSPAPVLDRITAPTLLLQGEQDSLFPLDQADANARGIAAAGTEVAVRWLDGGHDAGGAETGDELVEVALSWFDHHLRDGPDPGDDFEFALPPSSLEADESGERLRTDRYDESDDQRVELRGATQPVVAPPGGEPSAVTSLPGTGRLLGAVGVTGAGYDLAALPGQSAVFETAPATRSLTIAGAPRVRLSVTSSARDAVLFVSAWVVTADDNATLPRQLVTPLRLTGLRPGEPREVDVALPTSAYRVESDQRLRVVVSTTDAAYAVPDDPRVYQVGLAEQSLVLPTVEASRVPGTGALVPTSLLVVLGLVLLGALGLGVVARWRHRPPATDADLRDVPLAVDGLVKQYSSGFRAVDGVTWRAERGQVVGLLGPNGAGKTTTMRMLVGLISADAGTVHVLGERVLPGAPVLARVGALIEGPGFLPHLTGRENLRAYWAATGRPDDEAGYDDALDVADLGVAVDRPVRSYSHGMKQRLGIAQAMLGLPDLLLLDEPTNGLDPPQIRAMRGVLARYAAAGRTVVISSHLLAEVEQTCSHVVVMHRGQVVLEGAVAELVDDRRHLEEVFMGYVGDGGPAQVGVTT